MTGSHAPGTADSPDTPHAPGRTRSPDKPQAAGNTSSQDPPHAPDKHNVPGTADVSPRGMARGAVTAEFAVALPAVLALLAMLLAGAAAGMTQLRIEEGARAGARALARGEDPGAVQHTVRTLAGDSAAASIAADGEWFSITVTDHVSGPLGASIPWTLTARASTRSESPGTGGADGTRNGSGLTDGKGNR
ncbi:TadE family type IV pilus minor pilin [Pseudarthrobacter sp. AG30]|uniref:TadE family type IV pilus minor pilin n=1 Tax=Pseudarthrobacter sp. AG30 TaxID=2249742 RepID=UPI001F0C262C|nr:TadE family type IV pilus minor pilin [Pseudarthrobacter sp. AG30]